MRTQLYNNEKSTAKSKLILLHILFRHGNRTPAESSSYKNDPHKNNSYEPYGPGQLINKGKLALYNLGEYVRQRYGDFLGDEYRPGIVDARSSYFDRTQMSLQLFLAGLFPPAGRIIWNPKLNWQPIPYHSKRRHNDKLLLPRVYYNEYNKLYSEHQKEIGVAEKYKDLFNFLTKNTGNDIKEMVQVWRLYLRLQVQKEFGVTLLKWANDLLPKLSELAYSQYLMEMSTPKLRYILIGDIANKIIEDTRKKLAKKVSPKIYIYSAHELNVAHLLISMNSFEPHMPSYGSCLIFEVREAENKTLVAVFYKANPYEETRLLSPWNQNPCTFDNFVSLINKNFE